MTTAYRPQNSQSFNTIEDLVSDFFGEESPTPDQDLGSDAAAPTVDPEIEQIIEGEARSQGSRSAPPTESRTQVAQDLEHLKTALQQKQLNRDPGIQSSLQRVESFITSGVEREIRTRQQRLRQVTEELVRTLNQAESPDQQLSVIAQVLHRLLKADRVVIYALESEQVIAEAVTRGYTPMVNQSLPALIFGVPEAQDLYKHRIVAIPSAQRAKLMPYQQQLWQQYQINASLALPLWEGDQIWGLVGIQQCRRPRSWQDLEVELVSRAIAELTRSRQQARFVADSGGD